MIEMNMHNTCYFILLVSCIDQGGGSWKKKDVENLHHDIEIFRKMADKIEHEIKEIYDELSEDTAKHDDHYRRYKQNLYKKFRNFEDEQNTTNLYSKENITNDSRNFTLYGRNNEEENKNKSTGKFINIFNTPKQHTNKNNTWPKFEDILLSIGKKYDWKTDRWIKVKEKKKESRIKNLIKHKFIYRTIKLSKSKNKRNIVTVVTAVR